ncbi:hypothetical protein HanIR_Chr16g0840021 [Helianthus annuus]|nr:hypothetical protein HanIR_Chr16g0840021 [Helianthus annuus]
MLECGGSYSPPAGYTFTLTLCTVFFIYFFIFFITTNLDYRRIILVSPSHQQYHSIIFIFTRL